MSKLPVVKAQEAEEEAELVDPQQELRVIIHIINIVF